MCPRVQGLPPPGLMPVLSIEVVARCMYDGGDLGRFDPGVHMVFLHLHAVPLTCSNVEGALDDTQTEPLLVRVVDHRQDLFKLGAPLLRDP